MKKTILFPVLSLVLVFSFCGPASENRKTMVARAKVFQDSIANAIHVQMNEAEDQNHQAPLTGAPGPSPTAGMK